MLCDEGNFSSVRELVEDICATIGHKHDIRIIINQTILNECLLKARQTVGFYGSDFDPKKVSPYKEAAHIGFWINKLKPCHVASPSFEIRSVESYLSRFAGWLSGVSVENQHIEGIEKKIKSLEAHDEAAREIERDIRYNFPINENLALNVSIFLIRVAQAAELDEISPLKKGDLQNQISFMRERIEAMQQDMVAALRYYNFSARGYAVLLEMATKLHIS